MSRSGEHRIDVSADALALVDRARDTEPPESGPDTERDPQLWRWVDHVERGDDD